MPLIDFMGGGIIPPNVEPVATAYMFVMFYGFLFLAAGTLAWLGFLRVADRDFTLEALHLRQTDGSCKGIRNLAIAVIVSFGILLPAAQREQMLRYNVERNLKHNNIEAAIECLTSHSQREFPPQWTPPPYPEYGDGDKDPNIVQVVKTLQSRPDIPDWVHESYREKSRIYLSHHYFPSDKLSDSDYLLLSQYSGYPYRRDPHNQ